MDGKIIWRAQKLRSSICLLWQAQCVAADPLIQSISPSFNEICVARKYVCARRRHRGRKYAAHQPTNQTNRASSPRVIGDGNLPLKQLKGVRKGLFLRLLARSLSAVCRCCLYSAACKQTASLRLFTTLTLLEWYTQKLIRSASRVGWTKWQRKQASGTFLAIECSRIFCKKFHDPWASFFWDFASCHILYN